MFLHALSCKILRKKAKQSEIDLPSYQTVEWPPIGRVDDGRAGGEEQAGGGHSLRPPVVPLLVRPSSIRRPPSC